MGRHRSPIPKHYHHKASGRGYTKLDGKCVYTGVWGTQAAEDKYHWGNQRGRESLIGEIKGVGSL